MAERGCLRPWEKEIATAEPVGMSCCYNIVAEVVKIQMKHLRSSFTTLLAHELSMGEKDRTGMGLQDRQQSHPYILLMISPFGMIMFWDCKLTCRTLLPDTWCW